MFFILRCLGIYLLLFGFPSLFAEPSGLPLFAAELERHESLYDKKLAELPEIKIKYSGSPQDLIDFLTTLIKIDPKRSEGYVERAEIYNIINQYDRELEDLSIALTLEPENLDLLESRIATSSFLHTVALENTKYLGGYPKHRAEVYGQAVILDRDRLSELMPEDAHNVYERGKIKVLMGDVNGGIQDFNLSIELFPFPFAYMSRSEAKEQLGDLQGALSDYVVLLAESPEDIYYYLQVQRINVLLGDLKSACNIYNQAIKRFGKDVQGYPNLILVDPNDCKAV